MLTTFACINFQTHRYLCSYCNLSSGQADFTRLSSIKLRPISAGGRLTFTADVHLGRRHPERPAVVGRPLAPRPGRRVARRRGRVVRQVYAAGTAHFRSEQPVGDARRGEVEDVEGLAAVPVDGATGRRLADHQVVLAVR